MHARRVFRGERTKKILAIVIPVVLVLLIAAVAVMALNNGSQGDSGSDQGGSSGADDSTNTDDGNEEDDGTDEVASADNGTAASIVLGRSITVDGETISTDASSVVYLTTSDDGYDVVNIVKAGTYTISGTATSTQVYVNAGDSDEVVLVLNGTSITCSAAPAILVSNAYDPQVPGESGVTIQLAEGTTNVINGSHTDDNDAALSSNVSILIEGDGTLEITADNEGIETCMHLTIDSGTILVSSDEDAINANEDNVSYITINGGTVYADASGGTDGDGIDSNGYLIINGGTVYGLSSGANCGLDSDLGTVINGGTVFAMGSMNDGVSGSSEQACIDLTLSNTLTTGTLIYVTDQSGDPIVAIRTLNSYSTLIFSSPDLSDSDTYKVYVGGTVSGSFDDLGVCSSFTVTSAGALQTSSPR